MLAKFLKRHRYRDDWAQRDFYLSVAEGKICYGLPANQYVSTCRDFGNFDPSLGQPDSRMIALVSFF